MKSGVIIQAHVNSSRLPKKVLLPLGQMSVLEHVVEAACNSIADTVIIATTSDSSDDPIQEEYEKIKEKYPKLRLYRFHGNECDLLSRTYHCSKEHKLDTIIRITSDCYNHDSHIIDTCLRIFRTKQPDFLYFTGNIDGWDTQIVSFSALERTYKEATEKYHLEHVFPYIYENKDKFRIINLNDVKMSIDTEADYVFAKELFS